MIGKIPKPCRSTRFRVVDTYTMDAVLRDVEFDERHPVTAAILREALSLYADQQPLALLDSRFGARAIGKLSDLGNALYVCSSPDRKTEVEHAGGQKRAR